MSPELHATRAAEYAALRDAGARDLAGGRLFEGHVNALQLIALYGTEAQRGAAAADVTAGALFGVWNTQDGDGVRFAAVDRDGVTLAGRKTFCSGAGRVTRAIVTATAGDGTARMLLVPMDRVDVAIDPTFWRPFGMEASDSYAVDFTGVRLANDACIGTADVYQREPWFSAGAARFVAVQTGACERLADELTRYLVALGRDADPIQRARLGECAVHARTAVLWSDACALAWQRYDDEGIALPLMQTVDAARVAVERAALAIAELVERAVGARGLLEPHPFGRALRDLRMYLRQPNPDGALARVGTASAERFRSE